MLKPIFAAFFLLFLSQKSISAVSVSDASAAITLFKRAAKNINAGEYALARLKLQDILQSYSKTGPVTEAKLLLIVALYGLEDFKASIQMGKKFLKNHPHSPHADNVNFYLAKAYHRKGNVHASLELFTKLLVTTKDTQLQKKILVYFKDVPQTSHHVYKLKEMRNRYSPEEAKVTSKKDKTLTLGLICPLTGDYAEVGDDILSGAVMAVKEYNKKSKRKIKLIVEDSQGDLIKSVKAARKLAVQDNVVAIAGPVLSNTTIAAAALAECLDIPLVSPTAWQHGIASIGTNIFQANVPGEIQGALIADHAIKELGYSTFAILAPFDSYGKALARGFEDKVRAAGATIVSREWYYEGAMDYTHQLVRIRRRELIKTLNLIDVTDKTDVEALARGDEDSEKVRVSIPTIDAIFIPAYPEEIPMLASQVAFFNLETKILGGDRWNDDTIYKEKQYVEGAIFPGIIVKRRNSSVFRAFINRYRQAYHSAPDDVSLLAFDGMNLLIQAIKSGADTRNEIQEYLAQLKKYEGVTRSLKFSKGKRFNSHLDFLTIKDGRVIPWKKLNK